VDAMRLKRKLGFVAVLALAAASTAPLGAAAPVQECHGPSSTTQSGRASLSPGVNGLGTKQQISFKISLFSCSPNRLTRGAGTLTSTFNTASGQTCAMFNNPTALKMTAKITWKSDETSTLSLTYSFTGKTQLVNVTGKVGNGLFKGHSVSGQLRYKKVVSPYGVNPNGDGVAQACVNQVKPKKHGRIAIVSLNLYTTKHFVIA
jgi:hypothetical protein